MTTQISSSNIQAETLATIGGGPKVAAITVTNSSYAPTGATAVPTTGGYLQVTGSGFSSGIQVTFNKTPATAVSFVNTQTLNVQVPPLSSGTYNIYVINTNGAFGLKPASLIVNT
jgi:hypothetical protein